MVKTTSTAATLSFILIGHSLRKCAKVAGVIALTTFALPRLTLAQHYHQTNLISDRNGMAAAPTLATAAFGINSEGDITGTYDTRTGSHGFLLRNGTYYKFDVPAAANFTEAKGINSAGDIVGDYVDRRGNTHGFLLHDGVYTTLDDPRATGDTFIFGINNAGDIVGAAIFSGERQGFLLHHGIYTTLEAPGAI